MFDKLSTLFSLLMMITTKKCFELMPYDEIHNPCRDSNLTKNQSMHLVIKTLSSYYVF